MRSLGSKKGSFACLCPRLFSVLVDKLCERKSDMAEMKDILAVSLYGAEKTLYVFLTFERWKIEYRNNVASLS